MAEIAALTAALNKRIRVYDSQQHEIMALTSQSDVLRMQLAALARPATQALVPADRGGSGHPRPNGDGHEDGHEDGDVIRRALEAIEANGHVMPHGWASAPSGGAVPFGH